jgi:hypothetical protein
MAIARRAAAAAFTSIALVACLDETATPPPVRPCVDGFHTGQMLTVVLGAPYDAASDYYYPTDNDAQTTWLDGSSRPSCQGIDGLAPGSLVTFELAKQLSVEESPSVGCGPYARFDPASIEQNLDLIVGGLRAAQGISIAVSFTGKIGADGGSDVAIEQLLSPSKQPSGALTAAQLPPLVVSRGLDNPYCYDAWIATWAASP